MSSPFLPMASAFLAGVWIGEATHGPAVIFLALAVAALGLAWREYRRRREIRAAVWALVVCTTLGAAILAETEARFAGHPLRALPAGSAIELTGVLAETPSLGIDRDQLILRAERAVSAGRVVSVVGLARISVPRTPFSGRLRIYRVGDRLRLAATVLPPREFANFSPPFSERYLRTQGLNLLAAVKSGLLIERTSSAPGWSPRRLISSLRRAFLDVIGTGFSDPALPGGIRPEGAVLEALLLGERGRMSEELTRSLQKTGLFHLIAISGAHIGIIAVFLFAVLRACRVSDRAASMVLIGLLVFYAFLVEGRASVVRAVVMAVLYLGGRLLWKDVSLLNTLALSALLILIADPFQLFDQGFTLTYAATLAILLFYGPILKRLPRLPLKLSEAAALSFSAQIGVLPLTVAAFHRVALSGIPLNFIAVPLVSVIMAAGYVFLPLGLLGAGVARLGAAVLKPLVAAFIRSLGLLDGVPFLSYRVPTLSGWFMAAYAAAFLALLVPARSRFHRRIVAAAAACATALVVLVPFPIRSSGFRVTILDVGQGDSILIEAPGTEPMLIDGGGSAFGTFDIGENVVSPALWDRHIRRLGLVVLTHDHPDHRRGLLTVARNFKVREFWEPPGGARDEEAETLDAALAGAARWKLAAGTIRRFGRAEIEVLSPEGGPAPPRGDENDRSLVIRLTYGKTSFLLPGDIGSGVESRLVRTGKSLRSDVLKVPHHGSRTSSSEEFLAAVSPRLAVVTAGRGNRYGLPHPDALGRLGRTGARLLRTDFQGAVEFSLNGETISVKTARPP
ncbi:MAG: DNA internalization-related competence protein ComEC/Rec2 [Candidatus Aminicenantes bacterium]|nr:DNA internalization-related competence protein ComEC/Rec2 [Candidatus Aminicenantes bacterium]